MNGVCTLCGGFTSFGNQGACSDCIRKLAHPISVPDYYPDCDQDDATEPVDFGFCNDCHQAVGHLPNCSHEQNDGPWDKDRDFDGRFLRPIESQNDNICSFCDSHVAVHQYGSDRICDHCDSVLYRIDMHRTNGRTDKPLVDCPSCGYQSLSSPGLEHGSPDQRCDECSRLLNDCCCEYETPF